MFLFVLTEFIFLSSECFTNVSFFLLLFSNRIQYISLAKIYGLTDIAMSVLARECTSLNHLNVQGCWRISDDSVR